VVHWRKRGPKSKGYAVLTAVFCGRSIIRWLSLCICLGLSGPAWGRPRPPWPPLPERASGYWRFDQTNWWETARLRPLTMRDLFLVESWSGYAVDVSEPGALLRLPAFGPDGQPVFPVENGSIRFWVCPRWSSVALGGAGPGGPGILVEAGAWTQDASLGWWGLSVSADGNVLRFGSQANGESVEFLVTSVSWQAGQWYQVALTYCPTGSAVYINGQLGATGTGVTVCPDGAVLALGGFGVGSDGDGNRRASCLFDELTTFSHPLSEAEVLHSFVALWPVSLLGAITPEEDEARRQLAQDARLAGALGGLMEEFDEGEFGDQRERGRGRHVLGH
jgi:hypothetical protein